MEEYDYVCLNVSKTYAHKIKGFSRRAWVTLPQFGRGVGNVELYRKFCVVLHVSPNSQFGLVEFGYIDINGKPCPMPKGFFTKFFEGTEYAGILEDIDGTTYLKINVDYHEKPSISCLVWSSFDNLMNLHSHEIAVALANNRVGTMARASRLISLLDKVMQFKAEVDNRGVVSSRIDNYNSSMKHLYEQLKWVEESIQTDNEIYQKHVSTLENLGIKYYCPEQES